MEKWRENCTTDNTEICGAITDYYKQLYSNNSDNLGKNPGNF